MRLKEGVEALGAGDLASRVPVEGRDEVALLASSFNRAAGRIEELVEAQRRLLANASHELRSPLGRMRVAAGLLSGDAHLKDEIARDVAELDDLDLGPGVPPDLTERMFEPFLRLPGAKEEGTGLGLAIARQVARRHGGDVTHLPRPGGGSLFRATLG